MSPTRRACAAHNHQSQECIQCYFIEVIAYVDSATANSDTETARTNPVTVYAEDEVARAEDAVARMVPVKARAEAEASHVEGDTSCTAAEIPHRGCNFQSIGYSYPRTPFQSCRYYP